MSRIAAQSTVPLVYIQLLFIGFICGPFPASAMESFPDRLALLGLLENRQYSDLQRLVHGYQLSYDAGKGGEGKVAFVLETLANSDPKLESTINEWLSISAGDYLPYLVRAWYYYDLAWSWRGHLSKEKTSNERLVKMQNYLRLASDDLSHAIEIKPRLSVADSLAIKLLMLLDGREYMKPALQEALQLNPDSLLVRASYMWTLKPEWGGKPETLLDYIAEVRKSSEEHPQLKQLLGYSDYIFAASLARQKRFEEAAEHFDFAIQHGADHLIYRDRGINYYRMGDYSQALENLNQSLELWPQAAETLRWRSFTYQRLGKNNAALADLDVAVRINPMNKYVLMAHAKLSRKMKQYEQVIVDYDRALYYNADDAVIWFERGMHYSHELLNFQSAEMEFNKATELAPGNPDYWYEYAAVLHYNVDCRIVTPLTRYLDLCNTGASCRAGELKWAEDARHWLEQSKRC